MRRFPFNTYINFGLKGSRAEREQFAGSLYTALYAGAAHTNTLAWISNSAVYADIISTVINNSMIQNWCAQNEEHAEELCAEILAFIDSVDNYLERETAPCETERALCRELAALDQHDFIEAWPDIAGYLHQCYNGAVNIQFIAEELAKTRRRSAARHFKQVKDYLLARLQQLLDIEITAWYNNVFKTRGAVFLQELCERIAMLNLIGRQLVRAPDEQGRLWNTSKGVWQKASYAVLEEYAAGRDIGLCELARMLGRSHKHILHSEHNIKSGGSAERSAELDGITFGAALNMMLPEEAALLCEDSVESLFYKKWREQKLLVYNIARETQDKGRTKNTPRSEAGPFVLCIDTSGSMRGAAEKTAKSLVFALLREAFNTSRRCYLISFSTEISVLELSNLAESLGMLLDFLAMNFYGGSQIENALNEAVRVLQTEAYHNADVVLVSDFVLPAPDDVLASRILAAQENGTMFHGILTGIFADKLVNHSLLSLFDTVRSYDVF